MPLVSSALLGAVLGALIAGLFALVGAYYKGRSDFEQWLRDQRLRAYADVMTASHVALHTVTALRGAQKRNADDAEHYRAATAAENALQRACLLVLLLGPADVWEAADEIVQHFDREEGTEDEADLDVHSIGVAMAKFANVAQNVLQHPKRRLALLDVSALPPTSGSSAPPTPR